MLIPSLLAAAALAAPAEPSLLLRDEKHLRNLRQLTFGGENAEGYWSPDGTRLIFQSTREGAPCDQEFILEVESGRTRRVSSGVGRTTCGYFLDGGKKVLYASTYLAAPECPPRPDFSQGYVWAMYPGYDIFTADADGGNVRRLTETPGYDAEATVSPDGQAIVFTSVRDGDLEIYTMGVDGRGVKRLTHEPGYDGGAFFSPDGKRIVYRREAPPDEAALARYRELLGKGLYAPGALEIWVMDRDGANKRQVTRLGAASFAPFFHPDGKRIIFASNHPDPRGRNFDLYLVHDDGGGLERITSDPTFDGFPMFSPDGKRLVFASNRGAQVRGETNLFLADWVEQAPGAAAAAENTPEDVARAYFESLRGGDWRKVAAYFSPEAQAKYRGMMVPLLEAGGEELHELLLGGPASKEELARMSDGEFLEKTLRAVAGRALAAGAEFKRVEIVGAVTERPGLVHVVSRMFVGAANLPDLEIEKLVVVSLERGAAGWGVSLSGEMKGMAGAIKAQLQAKQRAKPGK